MDLAVRAVGRSLLPWVHFHPTIRDISNETAFLTEAGRSFYHWGARSRGWGT